MTRGCRMVGGTVALAVQLALWMQLASGQAVNITTPPMDMVVTSGDSFNLTCVAEGETPPTINWEHGNGVLVGNGQVVGNDLVFVEALPDHAGVYVCVARSGGDTARASANVTVNYAPEFLSLGVVPSDEVINASIVSLTCTMAGHPPPNVTWFHNGQEVLDSANAMSFPDGVLLLPSVRLSDAGVYSCNGTNSLGTAESDTTIMLRVYYPPMDVSLRGSPPDFQPELGEMVQLTCSVASLPAATYTWWRLEGVEETEVTEMDGVMLFDGNGTLQFDSVRREDAGTYYCNASNPHGSAISIDVELLVSAPPLPPVGVSVDMTTPYSTTVHWDTITNAYPAVSHYIVEYRLDLPNHNYTDERVGPIATSQQITDLLPHADYVVRVRGENPAGLGDPSVHFRITTPNGVPQQFNTTQSHEVTVTGPRSLTVQWTVQPDVRATSYTFTSISVTGPNPRTLQRVSSPVEVTGLAPASLHTVQLVLNFEGGATGPAVQAQRTTAEDAPDTSPQDIQVASVTATNATVSWTSPLMPNGVITSYTISYSPVGGSGESEVEVVDGEDMVFVVITGLRPFTNYSVEVFANTSVGAGPADTASFMTLQSAPPPPDIVAVYAISSTSLVLSWQLDEGEIPGILANYTVTYRRSNSSEVGGVIPLPPGNMTVMVEGLGVWSHYELCVRAATEGGGEGEENCTTQRTLGAVPDLQLTLQPVTASCPPSLLVAWEPVLLDLLPQLNGPEEEAVYTVQWEGVVEGGSANVNFSMNTTSYSITGLPTGTEFNVTVAIFNSNGTGPLSVADSVSTPAAGAPTVSDLVVMAGPTSLYLSWTPPPPSPTYSSYTFTITVTYNSPAMRENTTSNTFLNITDLTPSTGYILSVATDGGCGLGVANSTSHNTLEAPPGPPVVTVATVSADSVAVSWGEPNLPNGHITSYQVVCGAEDPVSLSSTDLYYVCSELPVSTSLSVTVWAVNGAGAGEMVTVNTATACQGGVLVVKVEGEDVTVGRSEGCPREAHALVVVQVGPAGPRPLASYSLNELVQLTREYSGRQRSLRQLPLEMVYITANLTAADFPFRLGDGEKYGDYTNFPLFPETTYLVGVVGVPEDSEEPAVFTASRGFESPGSPGGGGGEDSTQFPVVAVAAAAGTVLLLLVAVLCIGMTTLVCCRRTRRGVYSPDPQLKGSTHSFERSGSVRISGRRGNKPTDPVEEYRANYHTESLEAHSPVPINVFINKLLVMRTNDNQLFLEEFGSIEMAPQQPCSVAELPANRSKNRYHNILPYDHSRVKLSHSKGQSDYINASYCSGFMKVQGFIATQGPLPDTVPDFWRLVWEQNAHTIVMLTNAQERMKTKCEVYWPREVGCSTVHGSIEVTLTDFTQLADYTIRSLTLNKAGSGKEGREVRQFHFTSWPDHGVPQYATAMLAMVRRVQAFHLPEGGPMVVHCSAGVGRTGTFIVIYSMLERMKAARQMVDIYGHVSLLRTQRNYMVQTEDQYFFIYEAVAEVIVCGDTEVPLEQLGDYVNDIVTVAADQTDTTDHSNIELQFKRLAVDKTDAFRFASANKDVNKAKNRYVNVLPYENRRVVLQYQRAQEGSDYINASFIDGYHYRNAFIATQGPLQNTLADFWRMVWEHNVPVIIMLTKCHEKGTERSTHYWPREVGKSLQCGLYSVEMTVERKSEHYTYRDLLLVDTQCGRRRQVRHFHYLSWPEVGVPSSSLVLLDFLREVQKNFVTLNTRSPITIHCSNGIGRSGVFIALHILLERMVAEGLVDVFQTIKNLRIQRPAMVQTLEQYQFCYTATLDYLESSDLINQLRSSTRSDTRSLKGASNASELRSSRRSLARNDSLRSSTKRSSRNFELGQVGNGVSTTVYGGSEATSTFGTTQQPTFNDCPYSQRPLRGAADLGDGSGTPVPPQHSSLLPPSASPGPRLLANPYLAHLDSSAGAASSQSQLSSGQGSSTFLSAPGSAAQLQSSPASGSYHSLAGSQGNGHSPSPQAPFQTSTLPSRSQHAASGPTQSHWVMAGGSASHSSLGQPGGNYPVSSFGVGVASTSDESLERQLASLALNLNNSNNNVVDVYIEP